MSLEEIRSCLKKHCLKNTCVRVSVLEKLSKSSQPLTANDLLQDIKANKTTIYREIDKLVSLGLITEVVLGDSPRRYEITSNTHRHYLICSNCKTVTPIDMDHDFSEAEKLINEQKNFLVKKHNLEFIGLCQSCL